MSEVDEMSEISRGSLNMVDGGTVDTRTLYLSCLRFHDQHKFEGGVGFYTANEFISLFWEHQDNYLVEKHEGLQFAIILFR